MITVFLSIANEALTHTSDTFYKLLTHTHTYNTTGQIDHFLPKIVKNIPTLHFKIEHIFLCTLYQNTGNLTQNEIILSKNNTCFHFTRCMQCTGYC